MGFGFGFCDAVEMWSVCVWWYGPSSTPFTLTLTLSHRGRGESCLGFSLRGYNADLHWWMSNLYGNCLLFRLPML